MRGYFTGRILDVEVSDRINDDGSRFVNVSFIGDGSKFVENLWCYNAGEVFEALGGLAPGSLSHVGLSANVSAKANKGGGARLSGRIEAVYVLDADGNPVVTAKAKASANGTA